MHDDDLPEYDDGYQDAENAPLADPVCPACRVMIIEQSPMTFWGWLFGRRYLSPKQIAQLEKRFAEHDMKVVVLPPGAYPS